MHWGAALRYVVIALGKRSSVTAKCPEHKKFEKACSPVSWLLMRWRFAQATAACPDLAGALSAFVLLDPCASSWSG
eukprot:1160675-Pelagomonas_calceolata.AAC.15